MKKEVFLAITIGFVLGLVITFGVWTANKSLKNIPSTTSPTPSQVAMASPAANPEPSSSVTQGLQLTLTSPVNEAFLDKATVSVSGKTIPNATIAIIAETGELIITADASGNFSSDIDLEGGYNNISVTAFDASGASANQKLYVTYSTTKI